MFLSVSSAFHRDLVFAIIIHSERDQVEQKTLLCIGACSKVVRFVGIVFEYVSEAQQVQDGIIHRQDF